MQVSIFDTKTENIYMSLIQKVTQLDKQKQIGNIKEAEFRMIVERTVQFKRMKDVSQEKFLKGRIVCVFLSEITLYMIYFLSRASNPNHTVQNVQIYQKTSYACSALM